MKETFYLARGNIVGGHQVFRKPPIKIFRVFDVSVCWNGELVCHMYGLDLFLTRLRMNQASCMKVEVEEIGDEISIKVIDRDVDCKVSYY